MEKKRKTLPAVLTIAGSDSSGGAGIQADLKTMEAYGVYGMSVITAITAQNTCGVSAVENVSGGMIKKQLEAVFEDIFPAAVKIGMLSTLEAVEAAADCLEKYHAANVVLDPVLVSTSGRSLLAPEAGQCMRERLFPLACLITPNIPEMEEILGWQKGEIRNHSSMERAAAVFHERYGCDVLLKGGHGKEGADDLLYQKEAVWYPSERIPTTNTHGTGCTLSSAIACGLSLGRPLSLAVAGAKQYVRGAMSSGLDLGKGNGPLEHGWQRERDSTPSKV